MIIDDTKSFIFNTDTGNTLVELHTVRKYDIEDLMRDRALSLMLSLRFLIVGKQANVNQQKATRTLATRFFKTSEEV